VKALLPAAARRSHEARRPSVRSCPVSPYLDVAEARRRQESRPGARRCDISYLDSPAASRAAFGEYLRPVNNACMETRTLRLVIWKGG
jgi:hypothetical protein